MVFFFVESFFIDVSFLVVSVAEGLAGELIVVESFLAVVSLPLASFDELQPAAIEPIIIVISAKLKICFFIGCYVFVLLFHFITSIISALFVIISL